MQSVQKEPSHQDWVADHVRHVQLTVMGWVLLCVSVHVSRTTTELLMRGHSSPVHVSVDMCPTRGQKTCWKYM